jgi:hypothetical protein
VFKQTCAESHFFKEKSSQVIQKSSHDFDFFEKAVAADFYFIERYTSSLTIYLAKTLQIKQIREINQQLFEINTLLPENFARKVLYQIILQKAIKKRIQLLPKRRTKAMDEPHRLCRRISTTTNRTLRF